MVARDRMLIEQAVPGRRATTPGRGAAGISSERRLAALIGNRAMARIAADNSHSRGSVPARVLVDALRLSSTREPLGETLLARAVADREQHGSPRVMNAGVRSSRARLAALQVPSIQRWRWPWEDDPAVDNDGGSGYQGGGGESGGGGSTDSWDSDEEPNASYPPPTQTCAPCPPNPPPEIDRVPPSAPHHPCTGDHWHYRQYHQNPRTCDCFLSGRLFGGCCGSPGAPC
jgi:hypothetical protein